MEQQDFLEKYPAEFLCDIKSRMLQGKMDRRLSKDMASAYPEIKNILDEYERNPNIKNDIPFDMEFIENYISQMENVIPKFTDLEITKERARELLRKISTWWQNKKQKREILLANVVVIVGSSGIVGSISLEDKDTLNNKVFPQNLQGRCDSKDVHTSLETAAVIVRQYVVNRFGFSEKQINDILENCDFRLEQSVISKFLQIKGQSLSFSFSALLFAYTLRNLVKEKKIKVYNKETQQPLASQEINLPDSCIMTGAFAGKNAPGNEETTVTVGNLPEKIKVVEEFNKNHSRFFEHFFYPKNNQSNYISDDSFQITTISSFSNLVSQLFDSRYEITLETELSCSPQLEVYPQLRTLFQDPYQFSSLLKGAKVHWKDFVRDMIISVLLLGTVGRLCIASIIFFINNIGGETTTIMFERFSFFSIWGALLGLFAAGAFCRIIFTIIEEIPKNQEVLKICIVVLALINCSPAIAEPLHNLSPFIFNKMFNVLLLMTMVFILLGQYFKKDNHLGATVGIISGFTVAVSFAMSLGMAASLSTGLTSIGAAAFVLGLGNGIGFSMTFTMLDNRKNPIWYKTVSYMFIFGTAFGAAMLVSIGEFSGIVTLPLQIILGLLFGVNVGLKYLERNNIKNVLWSVIAFGCGGIIFSISSFTIAKIDTTVFLGKPEAYCFGLFAGLGCATGIFLWYVGIISSIAQKTTFVWDRITKIKLF